MRWRIHSIWIVAAIVTAFALGYKSAAWIPMAGSWFYTFQYGESWQIFHSYIDLGISIARLLGKIILILIGIYLWIQSKHIGKWVGAGLIITVSLSLLPISMAVPALLFAAFIRYIIHKINHKKIIQENTSKPTLQEDRQNYAAILDKWENNIQ